MGLNFRRLLISELERRQTEIDSMLALLRGLKGGYIVERTPAESPSKIWNSQGLPVGNAVRGTPAFYDEIAELRQQGLSLRAIALQVNLSHAGVWKALRRRESQTAEVSGKATLSSHEEPVPTRK
jgi:hypothetical protein